MAATSAEKARQRAKDRKQSAWYKLVEGDNTFRIMRHDDDEPWFEYRLHRDVGPNKKAQRCGKNPITEKGKCWLCDVQIPLLRKSGKEDRAAKLEASIVMVVQVAPFEEDSAGKPRWSGPKLWSPSKTVGDQLLASIFGSKKRDYTDPRNGYNLTISRTGTGWNDTRYGMIEPDQEPTRIPSEILAKLKPFKELKEIQQYSETKMKAAYVGREADEDDEIEDDEEETPKAKKKKSVVKAAAATGKKKPVVEEDDDDVDDEEEDEVDEEEEDDDEDEDEAPSKKKATVKKAAAKKSKVVEEDDEEEDDEEEDEDEEEEEDDEPPVKKKKATVKAAPGKKAKVVEEDDDEEDDEDDEEEEDDDPSPPPAKKKSAPPAKVPAKKKR